MTMPPERPRSETPLRDPAASATQKSAVDARQGVTGQNVRAVLFSGLALAIIAGVILYFTVGHSGVMP